MLLIYNECENFEGVVDWLWWSVFGVYVLIVDDGLFDGIGDFVDVLVVMDLVVNVLYCIVK